ncbi:endonuclease domain-containing protein [Nocardioides panacis]|uniref:Endonuclease domain-containing protein n=1 Tax=Nocardioides panacis TaxID=2849501 RepID=A0A975Y098_9ACTN|nr:endonuclease domain-containing protein [Nocardioides panacis]QWZ08256.1 endonuclease domain-containing protein [Nocardioides panacis]
MTSRLARLLSQQDGVATLPQLVAAGVTAHGVRAHVDARRWTRYGDRCVVTHNSVPTRAQWRWIAVLDHRGPAALAGFSALEVRGFTFFGEEPRLIHVVVPRGARYHRFPGVKVHESRRFAPADVVVAPGVPRLPAARSAVDAGAWQPFPRYACGVLAAVVQQRLCSARDLDAALQSVGRVRHKQAMRLAVDDIAGGAEALGEIDVAAMCRRFDLRPPQRQRVRPDRTGRRRYLDCEWELADGRIVVLEVDGSHHARVEHWEADLSRERGIVASGRTVLRCTATEARYHQRRLAADLVAVGVPSLRVVRR